MKLYIKQKVFSWADRFTVKDESGADRYSVEGQLFSWGKKLHVLDMAGNEAAFIQQKVLSFLPRYFVFVNGEQVAEIVKEFTLLRPKYSIRGLGWEVKGNFWEHDYEIMHGGMPIVTIHKQWLSWGDCYEMDIAGNENEVIALAVVLSIDCAMASEAAAQS